MNFEAVRKAIQKGHIDWRKHSLSRLAERGIAQKQVIDVLLTGEQIESYEKNKPCPSGLFPGFPNGRPLHVVAALDEAEDMMYYYRV